MRLLFLTPQLPYPPRQGTALRNWGLISHLATRHEVWLLSFDERPANAGHELPEPLRRSCQHVVTVPIPQRAPADRLRTLATSQLPDMAWRLWSPAFAQALSDYLREHRFDVLQVEGIELARYMPGAARSPHRARYVFDEHNAEYLLQKRTFQADARDPRRWHGAAYSFVQWQRLRAFERRALLAADAVLCVSSEDANALRRLAPTIQPHVIHNGIDVADYATFSAPTSDSRLPTVVFTGKMDFRPNVDAVLWFAQRVWPTVKQAHPRARWLIVGQKPSPRLELLRADPDIALTGQVEDVRPYIGQADVYVAPLLAGGGTRFKLLEAMAMRRAIVSTSLGCEGFPVTSGREVIIADRPHEFAGAVIELLRSETHRAALGESAYRFVSATYDWRVIVPRLEEVYEGMGARS
ncbi:MAG: glycosyltransferase [Anaerolineae bacterium]|nr:glycosyltransferase [Anaerolineae bacterium]